MSFLIPSNSKTSSHLIQREAEGHPNVMLKLPPAVLPGLHTDQVDFGAKVDGDQRERVHRQQRVRLRRLTAVTMNRWEARRSMAACCGSDGSMSRSMSRSGSGSGSGYTVAGDGARQLLIRRLRRGDQGGSSGTRVGDRRGDYYRSVSGGAEWDQQVWRGEGEAVVRELCRAEATPLLLATVGAGEGDGLKIDMMAGLRRHTQTCVSLETLNFHFEVWVSSSRGPHRMILLPQAASHLLPAEWRHHRARHLA